MTIRRVLPAMIVFAATFGGCVVLARTWLLEFLFRVGDSPVRVNPVNSQWPTYVAQTWFSRRGGPKLNPETVYGQTDFAPHPARWLAQHHLTE